MKKISFAVAALAAFAVAVPAGAVEVKVLDPTPNGVFSDSSGNKGYVEVDTDERAARACNENPNTPAGDDLTGYIYLNANGESTTPTYGNANIGAADADGEDGSTTNTGHDCP